ncbi:hypothetical protein Tco_0345472 [Tanacetum coccineum]
MAQPQRPADVHQDELCPPNKRYALMDANKKIDLDNPLYPNESKIMANIIQNHSLRFNIAASSFVPWIYMGQFWHTLQEDRSKYKLKFVLDKKYIIFTLNDFRGIFHLPQATDNNHKRFVVAPKFSEMGQIRRIFLDGYGVLDVRTVIFKCLRLSSRMRLEYGRYGVLTEVNTAYREFLGVKTTFDIFENILFPYLEYGVLVFPGYGVLILFPLWSFVKCRHRYAVSSLMDTAYRMSKQADDKYHNLEDDTMVKNIFYLGKHKDGVGMKIPSWMISDEMQLTDHYRMCAVVFRISLAEQKSHDELEVKQNVQKVEEHLIAEEIEKLVEGADNVENVEDDSSTLRQDDTQNIFPTLEEEELGEDDYELRRREKGKHVEESFFDELQECYGYLFEHLKTRFMPRKKFNVLAQHLQEIMEESLPKMVDDRVKELTKTQVPVYVAQGLIMERQQSQADINDAISNHIPTQVDSSVRNYMSVHILHVHPTQATPTSLQEQQQQLYLTIRDNPQLQQDNLPIWLGLKYNERLHVASTPCKPSALRTRDQEDPYDDAHLKGENDAKRQ